MELGPDLIALLARLRGLDQATLDGLLQDAGGAAGGPPVVPAPVPAAAAVPPRVPPVIPTFLPRSLFERYTDSSDDPLLAHYAALLPPYEQI